MISHTRPKWDDYFMDIIDIVKIDRRVTSSCGCGYCQRDSDIIDSYNGAPSGCKHCIDTGCLREEKGIPSGERHELCRASHAEQNAIVQAAKHGVSIDGGTIYVTAQPCVICSN